MLLALLSPIAQRKASTTLDLPQPLGPTMPVSPGRISTLTGSAKLLKPGDPQPCEVNRQGQAAAATRSEKALNSMAPEVVFPLMTKLGVASILYLVCAAFCCATIHSFSDASS